MYYLMLYCFHVALLNIALFDVSPLLHYAMLHYLILHYFGIKLFDVALFKGALSGLRYFLATESPLRMMKNAFYFTPNALFVLKIFKFLS